VIFLNLGNPVARSIVRDWISRHEEILEDARYVFPGRPANFDDQRLIQNALRDNPAWFAELHVESWDLMNSMHATFIRHHLWGITPDFGLRLESIRREVDEVMKKVRGNDP